MGAAKVFAARVTRQGQVTVPVALRRRLGVDGGGPVRFVEADGVIRLEAEPSIDDLFGVLPPLPNASEDFDHEIAEAISDAVLAKLARNDHP